MWNAGVDWPEQRTEAKALVTAWSTNAPPLYCAVDLTEGASADSYPVFYYTSAEALPYGGLTNAIYKSSYLLMRKIGNGAFNMDTKVCAMILTNDFYAGVFHVTQKQWQLVMDSWPSLWNDPSWREMRPVEQVSYYEIRENPEGLGSAISPNGPDSDEVGPNSFMGKLRSKTELPEFDLPTEAQWEYACRAGTVGDYNAGSATDLPGRCLENGESPDM